MQYTALVLHGTKRVPCLIVQPRVEMHPPASRLLITIEHKLFSLFLAKTTTTTKKKQVTLYPNKSAVFFKRCACAHGIIAPFLPDFVQMFALKFK